MDTTSRGQTDRERLVQFFLDLQDTFEYFVSNRRQWLSERDAQLMLAAWREVQPLFTRILSGLTPDRFVDGTGELIPSDDMLQNVGLTGKELDFKLALFNSAFIELQDLRRTDARQGQSIFWRLMPNNVKRMFGQAINNVKQLPVVRTIVEGAKKVVQVPNELLQRARSNKAIVAGAKVLNRVLEPANYILKSFSKAAEVTATVTTGPGVGLLTSLAGERIAEFKDFSMLLIKRFLKE